MMFDALQGLIKSIFQLVDWKLESLFREQELLAGVCVGAEVYMQGAGVYR